jgi:hypothetical protein
MGQDYVSLGKNRYLTHCPVESYAHGGNAKSQRDKLVYFCSVVS